MSENLPLKLKEFRPGMPFLQYQLLEEIGAGGQGQVWSAIDRSHSRIVAIKFSETLETNEQKRQDLAFEEQGKRLVALRHPNILPLYDFGSLPGLRYLVSLYIPGGSLFDQLSAGNLPTQTALQIAAHIAAGLDYLHNQGVIHRDLKPGNILVDLNRNIYLADFGLARVLSDSTQALHTGHGTPPYSPPEQHNQSEITIQSDIFSYGVMLYEFFTGHIPWNGEKALGIQQLYSHEEIPDPRDFNPDLPEGLVTVLRRMTAALPAARPKTASEAVQRLYEAFNLPPVVVNISKEPTTPSNLGAEELFKRSLAHWKNSKSTIPLSLTKFALVELEQKQRHNRPVPEDIRNFMLHSALAYKYNVDFWWKKVENPAERLGVCEGMIQRDNEALTGHVLNYLLRDPAVLALKQALPAEIVKILLGMAVRSKNKNFRANALEFLQSMARPVRSWQTSHPDQENDALLAQLASEDSPTGNQTARLIGALRSSGAVSALLKLADSERKREALLLVQETAGNLPASLPFSLRLLLSGEHFAKQLTANPLGLLRVYGLSALGVTLGIGLQVYLTYRLPAYMDLSRITISIERGLFMGLLFGLGIWTIRLLTELIPIKKSLPRAALATLAGGFVLTTSLVLYDLFFLNTLPRGFLFILGCFLISAGYALGGLFRPVGLKILSTLVTIFVALAGTWYGHVFLTATAMDMSPIFYYEYTWPTVQILGTMFAASLPMAVFGQLGKFSQD